MFRISIQYLSFVKNFPGLWKILREFGFWGLKLTYRKGIPKKIGNAGDFTLSPRFFFSDFESWGKGHNNGFCKTLDLARGKNMVFDVGAHIGLCSLPISRVINRDGMCYAFEPAKRNLEYLREHIKFNNIENVIVVPRLIGSSCNKGVEFFETNEDSGMNSICNRKKRDSTFYKVIREQITLDRFVEENNCVPGLIKIDVEGAEIDVLSGTKGVLKRYHPEIILSVHPNHLKTMGHTVDELVKLVSELGYQFFNIDGSPVYEELKLKEYYLN